jgi:hypothetical protein
MIHKTLYNNEEQEATERYGRSMVLHKEFLLP